MPLPANDHIAQHPAEFRQDLMRKLYKVNMALGEGGSPSTRALADIEQSLTEALNLVQAYRQDPAHANGMREFRNAVRVGDLPRMAEFLERGLRPVPGSDVHVEAWLMGVNKQRREVLPVLCQAGWGVPEDPLQALPFLQRAMEGFHFQYHDAAPMVEALRQHCKPGELLVTEFAALCVTHNHFEAFECLADLVDKSALPIRKLPLHGIHTMRFLDIPVPSQEVFNRFALEAITQLRYREEPQAFISRLEEAMELRLADGSKPRFPDLGCHTQTLLSAPLSTDQMTRLVKLGYADDETGQLARYAVRRNDFELLQKLLDAGVSSAHVVDGQKFTLAHELAVGRRNHVCTDGIGSDIKTLNVLANAGVDLSAHDQSGRTAAQRLHRLRTKLQDAFHAAQAQQVLAQANPTPAPGRQPR